MFKFYSNCPALWMGKWKLRCSCTWWVATTISHPPPKFRPLQCWMKQFLEGKVYLYNQTLPNGSAEGIPLAAHGVAIPCK